MNDIYIYKKVLHELIDKINSVKSLERLSILAEYLYIGDEPSPIGEFQVKERQSCS